MTITSRHPKAETEFGKGLIVCLVKFAEHAERWGEDKRMYEVLRKREPDSANIERFLNESMAVEMFFSGASDHLFQIEVPKGWEETEIVEKVNELREFCLMIGHGFTQRKHTEEDVNKAYDLCEEIALLIDRKLGLEPDIGQF